MFDEERIGRLQAHLIDHPHDAQAVIALLKARSDAIDHAMYLRRIEKVKKVAEVRRRYNEESELK